MTTNRPSRDQITLEGVMEALSHPIRLRVLAELGDGSERACGSIVGGVSKSTLTHHWRVLRDSGVINQRPSGRENLLSVRREDLDARFPGLLDVVLRSID